MKAAPQSTGEQEESGARVKDLGLQDRLGLIGLIDEGMRSGVEDSPVIADLFSNLWDLVDRTASGSRIHPLKPHKSHNGFRVLEIKAETGESLGRLNMLYLKKPMPCYYLVYVEVAPPFRRKGLGRRVLEYFREFLKEKAALGVLDNIIPPDDPTYSIYTRQAWEPVEAVLGDRVPPGTENYMIYVPPRFHGRDLKEAVRRIIHHLSRRRAVIDMRDNEEMVKRTISEFRELYRALLVYFEKEVGQGSATPLMRFMFTRFVTKLIAFRRRIGQLLGYTGGDSLEQLRLDDFILNLPIKSYAPPGLSRGTSLVFGEAALSGSLPAELWETPARFIESLPDYGRPSLRSWLRENGLGQDYAFTIGDLLDLGFDPTRLKELRIQGEPHIFERVQVRQLERLKAVGGFLERLGRDAPGVTAGKARLRVNPPVLALRDRGNGYVLRRKMEGIHWEEAVEQLQSAEHLKGMNSAVRCDRVIMAAVRGAYEAAEGLAGPGEEGLSDHLACFVPWDLAGNRPRMVVDLHGSFLDSVWLA